MKRRTIMCVDYNENALSDDSCTNLGERPLETEFCDINLPYCNGEEDNNENSNMIWIESHLILFLNSFLHSFSYYMKILNSMNCTTVF